MSLPASADYQLQRDASGRLVLIDAAGERHEGVVPVRAFPISAPEDGIALVDAHGHELAWIERIEALPAGLAEIVADELAIREFMPVISRIISVSSFATPSTWRVATNRGETDLVLKGEEDIRRLAKRTQLRISASDGVQFQIPDINRLDKSSRKLLERFL